jgi:hypothetical protein
MAYHKLLLAAGAAALFSCTLDDSSGPNFTCDATATVLEMCIQEPSSPLTQEASKSTCRDVKGTWTEDGSCPSSYKKKCKTDGKTKYYYAPSDANKTCSELPPP